jgi:hypothetical protein
MDTPWLGWGSREREQVGRKEVQLHLLFLRRRRCHSVLLDEWDSPRRPKLLKLFQSGQMRRTDTGMVTSSPILTPIPPRVSCPSRRFLVTLVAYPRFPSR